VADHLLQQHEDVENVRPDPFGRRGGLAARRQVVAILDEAAKLELGDFADCYRLRSASMTSAPPKWIKPRLTRLVDEAPAGVGWLHEIKYDGYRMHARIDGRDIKLLTRTGLDWSHRYRRTIDALRGLTVRSAYLDAELCALTPDGVPAFSRLQAAMDEGRTD
jgi:ATP-dependent DNA ligase